MIKSLEKGRVPRVARKRRADSKHARTLPVLSRRMFMDRVTRRESCKRHMAVRRRVRRGKGGYSAVAKDTCV